MRHSDKELLEYYEKVISGFKVPTCSDDHVDLVKQYALYPYKKARKASQPYVKKEFQTNHKYSINYQDWVKVITLFYVCLLRYMIHTGKRYYFDKGKIGCLIIYKKKTSNRKRLNVDKSIRNVINREKCTYQEARLKIKEHDKEYFYNDEKMVNGETFYVKLVRTKKENPNLIRLRHSKIWKFTFPTANHRFLVKYLRKNCELMDNFKKIR